MRGVVRSLRDRHYLVWALALGFLGALVLFDYTYGALLRLTAFYLLAVWLVAWNLDLRHGLAAAILCGAVGEVVDTLTGEALGFVWAPVLNGLMRVLLLATVAVLLTRHRVQLERQRLLARIDPLTGALNRRAVREEMVRSLARAQRHGLTTAVVCLDLDGFKTLNDRLGHAAGDAALKYLVATAQAYARKGDAVGRLGGDEFVLILGATTDAGAPEAARRLCAVLRAALAEHAPGLDLSAGACIVGPNDAADVDATLKAADALLYAAKRGAKDGGERLMIGWPNAPTPSLPLRRDDEIAII